MVCKTCRRAFAKMYQLLFCLRLLSEVFFNAKNKALFDINNNVIKI